MGAVSNTYYYRIYYLSYKLLICNVKTISYMVDYDKL